MYECGTIHWNVGFLLLEHPQKRAAYCSHHQLPGAPQYDWVWMSIQVPTAAAVSVGLHQLCHVQRAAFYITLPSGQLCSFCLLVH